MLHRGTSQGLRWARTTLDRGLRYATEELPYRRQEVIVLGLGAAGILGGYAVEVWHDRAPAVLDGLEADGRLAISRGSGPQDEASPWQPPPSRDRPLEINSATLADLTRLPGIGPRLADRIVTRRKTLGGHFDSIDQLLKVRGIGSRTLDRLRPLIRVTADSP